MRERLSAIELVLVAAALTIMGSALLGSTAASAQDSDEESDEVTVTHEGGPEAVGPGDSVMFTVSITNNTGEQLTGVAVVIDIAEEIFGERYFPLTSAGEDLPSVSSGGAGWSDLTIDAGETEEFSYRVTAEPEFVTARTIQNQATVTIADQGTTSSTVTIELATIADFVESTHRAVDNVLISAGESTTFEITVSNTNAAGAISGDLRVTLEDPIFADWGPIPDDAAIDDVDQSLVWRDVTVEAGSSSTFTYVAVAGPEGSTSPTVSNPATLAGLGDEVSLPSDPVKLAAAPSSITVTHSSDQTVLKPGEEVDFVVTVTNNSGADRSTELVSVQIETEIGLFADWRFGRCEEDAVTDPKLAVELLEGGEQFSVEYCGRPKPEFAGQMTGTNRAVVTVAGQELTAFTGDLQLANAMDSLDVDHRADEDELRPGSQVTYTVEVTNLNKVATISNVTVRITPHSQVFEGDPEAISIDPPASTDAEGLFWIIGTLEPEETMALRYTATAGLSLPQGEVSVQNTAVLSGPGDDRVEPSKEVRIAGASSDDPQPSIQGDQLFALIVAFLLLSFVSAVYLILNHKWGRRNNEVGIYLFTTISLLSATLILAFGTSVAGEGALSLLAAIAGYVLGRRFSDGGGDGQGEDPASVGESTSPDNDPGAGTATQGAGTATQTVATGRGSGTARQALGERIGRIPTVAEKSSANTWLLLASPILTPVLIVVTTLWLLDATGSSITRDTYLSAGVITALALLFVAVTGYLLLGHDRDKEARESGGQNRETPDPDPEAGPAESE